MAGFNVGALPYFIQAQGQLQAQEQARQQQQQQLLMFQQAQQDRQRQQAAQAAAGNALPQIFAGGQPAATFQGQMPPPPQPPAPGQGSQPIQQASGGVPLPQGPVPGQMQPPPLPRGGVQGQMPPPGIPPFRSMPTSPPVESTSPQNTIPAPPQTSLQAAGGPLNIQNAIKVLQDQGLEGADLMAGLQQLQPLLDTQAKQQAAQLQTEFNNDIKVAQLKQTAEYHTSMLAERGLDRESRERHQQALESIRGEMIGLRMQQIALSNGEDTKFSPQDLKFLAEQARRGDTSVYQNLGRGTQGARNIIALRREVMRQTLEEGGTGADIAAANVGYQGEKAAARTAGTKATNIELAASEAQKTFALVRKASAALPRAEFVPVNRALQAAQTNSGDTRVITLGTALNTSINAYARAVSPQGVPTKYDKEHARELLSTANTPEQLEAAFDIMEQEMIAARSAPKEVMRAQHDRIVGKKEPVEVFPDAPPVGTVMGSYRYKGGNPSKKEAWESVK